MNKEIREIRLKMIFLVLSAAALVILFRYAWIMLGPTEQLKTEEISLPRANRGNIFDRNGHILAIQTQLYSVSVWLPDVEDPRETALFLADILDLDREDLFGKISDTTGSRYRYISRRVSPAQSREIELLMEQGKLAGVNLEPEPGRLYPARETAAHVLGYAGIDNVGLDGIEYSYNDLLSPPEITSSDQSVQGNHVYLTIDIDSQYMVEKICRQAYETHQPDLLMALVMEARTGDIVSYVALPDYDPNHYSDYPLEVRRNPISTLSYEPGSVFKIFSLSSFLELGGIDTQIEFNTAGGFNPEYFQKYNIPPITDLGNYGTLDLQKTLIYSSNVGTAYASETVDSEDFYKMLKNYGFGKTTGLPLPGESNGLLNDPSSWSLRSKPTMAIGQEVGVSALQMIQAASVLANSGVLLEPHIVKRVVSPSGDVIKEYKRNPIREVLSPENAETILGMMRNIVESPHGTTRGAYLEDFPIAAKSGTAQIIDPETGQYSKDRFTASVLAIFPADDPLLIAYVVLINPKGESYYGGRIVSPIIRDIAKELAPSYNIPLAGSQVVEHSGRIQLEDPDPVEPSDTVPDFKGLPKRRVLPFFADPRVIPSFKGEGRVISQFPPPGTPIEGETYIFLEFQ